MENAEMPADAVIGSQRGLLDRLDRVEEALALAGNESFDADRVGAVPEQLKRGAAPGWVGLNLREGPIPVQESALASVERSASRKPRSAESGPSSHQFCAAPPY
jgi:hypothetical protein